MAEKYDNIRRLYDLQCLADRYFPQVKKGIFFKKMVPDRGNLLHARVVLTNDVLDAVGKTLDTKVELADINTKSLPEALREISRNLGNGKVELAMVDEDKNAIGSINYSPGITRTAYIGTFFDVEGGMEVAVFGNAIKSPEQFNALQRKL
jgi:hypothetical protein